jgi:hypothetical protein
MSKFAPGNQFWKQRSKHGRDALFTDAGKLREACNEYFEWVDTHPWWRNEPIKSGDKVGETMKVMLARPYTLSGLCIYLGCAESWWRGFKNSDTYSDDFSSVMQAVEQAIDTQLFEGAAVGAFNSNLIARKLGMVDKQEVTGKDGAPLSAPPQMIIVKSGNSLEINESE